MLATTSSSPPLTTPLHTHLDPPGPPLLPLPPLNFPFSDDSILSLLSSYLTTLGCCAELVANAMPSGAMHISMHISMLAWAFLLVSCPANIS